MNYRVFFYTTPELSKRCDLSLGKQTAVKGYVLTDSFKIISNTFNLKLKDEGDF